MMKMMAVQTRRTVHDGKGPFAFLTRYSAVRALTSVQCPLTAIRIRRYDFCRWGCVLTLSGGWPPYPSAAQAGPIRILTGPAKGGAGLVWHGMEVAGIWHWQGMAWEWHSMACRCTVNHPFPHTGRRTRPRGTLCTLVVRVDAGTDAGVRGFTQGGWFSGYTDYMLRGSTGSAEGQIHSEWHTVALCLWQESV